MINSILACSLVFQIGALEVESASLSPMKQVSVSKNIRQLLSSNADHFWSYNRDPKKLKDLAYYTEAQGVISGDAHLGNTTVIPVKTKQGQDTLRFVNVDFDDGGRGPFALEFARFVTMAKASSTEIKIKELSKAYLQGLNGRSMQKPQSILEVENLRFADYEAQRMKYVAKKMSEGHFKYKPGELEKWQGRPNIEDVKSYFKDFQVIEVARRPMERGGSLEGLRLWVLLRDAVGNYHISELKQYQETALAKYSAQPAARERIESLHDIYWPGLDPRVYDVVDFQGTAFWVRSKKVEILTYKDLAAEDEGRLYLAYLMGRTQALQAEGPQYRAKINNDPDRFREAVKAYSRDYLQMAEDVFVQGQ